MEKTGSKQLEESITAFIENDIKDIVVNCTGKADKNDKNKNRTDAAEFKQYLIENSK